METAQKLEKYRFLHFKQLIMGISPIEIVKSLKFNIRALARMLKFDGLTIEIGEIS